MAVLRSRRLAVHSQAADGGNELVYTVPGGFRAILRELHICNEGGNAATGIDVFIAPSGASFVVSLWKGDLAAGVIHHESRDLVLESEDLIRCLSPVAGLTVYLSGAEVSIPPGP